MGMIEEDRVRSYKTDEERIPNRVKPKITGGIQNTLDALTPRQRELLMGSGILTQEEMERPVAPGIQRHYRNTWAIQRTLRDYNG